MIDKDLLREAICDPRFFIAMGKTPRLTPDVLREISEMDDDTINVHLDAFKKKKAGDIEKEIMRLQAELEKTR